MAITAAQVEVAIKSYLETGQGYRLIDGTEVHRGNLQEMIDLRTRLQQEEAAAANQSGIFVPISFRRPC